MHLITQQLAVGDAEDVLHPPAHVSVILNVAAEHRITSPSDRTYSWIPFIDFAAPDPFMLDEAVAWLEQHDTGNVLICCRAGIGRSVSVAIAYLCLAKGLPYEEAFQIVSSRRPGATPLPDLEAAIRFVRKLRAKLESPVVEKTSEGA